MRWLVFGSKGWIGSYVVNYLNSIDETVCLDVIHYKNFAQLYDTIEQVRPDRIVCAIGRTFGPGFSTIDYLEQAGKLTENLESNLLLPVWIAQAAPTIPILYFGTGCIYEYDSEHPMNSGIGFTEKDEPNFTGSAYSTVKRITDKIMGQFPNVLNARIRMPISQEYHPRDFITKLLNYNKITSIPNSMTVLPEIIPILLAILYDAKDFGTVNSVNQGVMDHDTILRLHAEITGKSHEYVLESLEDQAKRLLSKRSNNELVARRLQQFAFNLQDETCEKFHVTRQIRNLSDGVRSILEERMHLPK